MTLRSTSQAGPGNKRREGADAVEQLVRLAQTPNPVNEDRKRSAFIAAEDEWAALVGKRKRRSRNFRWLAAAAGVTLAVLGGGVWYETRTVPTPIRTVAHVEALTGTVAIDDEAVDGGLTVGATLAPGTEITTGDGRLALHLTGGPSIRLDVESRLVLESPTRLTLERGALYFDSGSDRSRADRVEVATPLGSAYDIGTRYAVRLEDDLLRVRVREGHVRVERPDRTYEAPAGTLTTIDSSGRVERSFVASYATAWDWTLEIVPGFEIEGKPLREFLEWTSREAGWRLAYNNPRVPARAAEILMSGSIDDLTIVEALNAVLPASGLGYRIEAGVLIVTDAGGNPGR